MAETEFTISDALSVVPKSQYDNTEEIYQYASAELDSIFEKLVREGAFDLSKGRGRISVNSTSPINLMTEDMIAQYQIERGWNINLMKLLMIDLEVPTYLYDITLTDQSGTLVINQNIYLLLNGGSRKLVGQTDSNGVIEVNVADVTLPTYHPFYHSGNFVFSISQSSEENFAVVKEDTDYMFKPIAAQVNTIQG